MLQLIGRDSFNTDYSSCGINGSSINLYDTKGSSSSSRNINALGRVRSKGCTIYFDFFNNVNLSTFCDAFQLSDKSITYQTLACFFGDKLAISFFFGITI